MPDIIGEITKKRTKNSKHYLMSDGSFKAIIYPNDVHFEDEYGNLKNIDTTLFDEADFDLHDIPISKEAKEQFKAAKEKALAEKKLNKLNRDNHDFQGLNVPFSCKLPRNFKAGYSIGKGQDKLTFKPQKCSPSKGYVDIDDRSKIVYQDAWNDADVELKILPDGLKETIILKTNKAPTKFAFEVNGNIDNLTELMLQSPYLIDANGVEREVKQTIENGILTMEADTTGLAFPVEIDPTVTIISSSTKGKDSFVRSASPNNNYGTNNYINVGLEVGQSIAIALIEFDYSSIPQNSQIVQATLNLYALNVKENQTIRAHKILETWEETTVTFANMPTAEEAIIDSIYHTKGEVAWKIFNITSYVQDIVNGGNNYGIALSSDKTTGSIANYANYPSRENKFSNEYPPKTEVQYNRVPTAPTLTSPNGGEIWNAEHVITWQAATDPDNDQLRYNIQLSTDNGNLWKDIIALTNAGKTSATYDFSNETESSICLIRIRAYDGTSYGPYDTSDGVFTIQHNFAPSEPTNLSPSAGIAKDRAQVIRFSWQHNDQNQDPQSKFDLAWSSDGGLTWNVVTQATVNQYWDAPANLLPKGPIHWKVRTYDQADLLGPYSAQALFYAGDKPAEPIIVNPEDGAIVVSANPTLQWSSVDQKEYQIRVKDNLAEVVWDSGEIISINKAKTLNEYNLENNSAYTIELRFKNSDGLWSEYTANSITVAYTKPMQPIAEKSTDSIRGSITLFITDPDPIGAEPAVEYHDIYRNDSTGWIRIATNIIGQNYVDYTPASGKVYEYKVRSWGSSVFSDSAPLSAMMKISCSQLARSNGDWIELEMNPKRTNNIGLYTTQMHFAGREKAVTQFEEFEDTNLNLSFTLYEKGDLQKLEDIIKAKETVLYRDNRGKKIYGTISGLSMDDDIIDENWYNISFAISEVDYSEVV